MHNIHVPRAYTPEVQPRAGGLLGGDGLLGDPLSGLPGLGGLSSALSPIFTPIGLPRPGKSTETTDATTTSATTSATSTVSLTSATSSGTSTSVSATSTSGTSSATSASTTASETSSSVASSATSSQQTASDTDSATATTAPPPTNTAPGASLPASSVTESSSSASPSSTAELATTPKSFLQNKALSVGVITTASLVGLVLVIAIATWAIRKRRNDRIHRDILDFSTANLVSDPEKGGGSGGIGGSMDAASSNGHGSASSHGALSQPPVQPRGVYESAGYAPRPTYAPNPAQSRAVNPYPAQAGYQDRYAFPSQEQNNTYANWGYGYGAAAAPAPSKNPYDQAYGVDDAYGGIAYNDPQQGAMAGVGAGAQSQGPQRRPSAHRKPPPQLYIAPTAPIAEAVATNAPSPISSVSITKPPLQPAPGVGAAQPARRTSLLNSPAGGNAEGGGVQRERKDTLTHVELLDPSAPKMPATSPPLPDEFGASRPPASKDSPAEQPVRRLVVRNE
ncbi:hypothetical protein C8Q77DRAFT_1070345 [Trametes polyzona]|nr:hypothetical protein C8Q77DRAFT_1070345 [Trametes polyzona]